jgi:hypothetical protein
MALEPEGLAEAPEEPAESATSPFGQNSAEVEAFIAAAAALSSPQWGQVLRSRRLVSSVTKESTGNSAESLRSIRAALHRGDGHVAPELSSAGEALFARLGKQSSERFVAAWQAVSALVMRHHLPALKFAAHYAPFAGVVPLAGTADLDPWAKRFLSALEKVTAEQCEVLSRPWRLEHEASRALLHAVAKSGVLRTEEAVAVVALRRIPVRLAGDAGWAAARTAVHGGRVLGSRSGLPGFDLSALWAPLEGAFPLASLDDSARKRGRGASAARPKTGKAAGAPAGAPAGAAPPRRPAGQYGPNSSEVAAFVKGVGELTPIQWLRILDRRQLVSVVTREGSAEPAGVVRSLLAAIRSTEDLDMPARCRAFAVAERAVHALEHRARLTHEQVSASYGPVDPLIPIDAADVGSFANRLASLNRSEWEQVIAAAPEVNSKAVAPLVSAGDALGEFISNRSDDEAVAAWHAVSALVRRQQLTPIQFAASYAPFASAIPVTNPRALGAQVNRYVTAVGRLSASQCELLARPWRLDDEVSNALARIIADGSARPAEEAAALAAVVTVPMRVGKSEGWAAVKTAAFGGRVIASRSRLTPSQLEALWTPLQPAIALASVLAAPARR